MGHDRVLTVFSQHHPTLFKYLQQTFAEVTNPPIDPYREGGAMSLTTYLGRVQAHGPRPVGVQGEELPVRQMELPSPVISDAIVEEIRQNEVLGFKLLDATFPLSRAVPTRCARSLVALAERRGEGRSRRLPRALRLGQGGVQARHRPDPVAARARGGPPVPVPPGAARPVQPHRAGRRHPGRPRHLLPRRVRRGRGSPVPDAPAREGRADVQGRRTPSRSRRSTPREALENLFAALEDTHQEGDFQDGHHHHRGVPRGATVRGGRVRPGTDGVPRRLPQPRRRHRLRTSWWRTRSGASSRPRR